MLSFEIPTINNISQSALTPAKDVNNLALVFDPRVSNQAFGPVRIVYSYSSPRDIPRRVPSVYLQYAYSAKRAVSNSCSDTTKFTSEVGPHDDVVVLVASLRHFVRHKVIRKLVFAKILRWPVLSYRRKRKEKKNHATNARGGAHKYNLQRRQNKK